LHTIDSELSAGQSQKEGFIVLVEEVESAIRPCLLDAAVSPPRFFRVA
jgi:hypothetical protein